uniref:Ig-like domain-containing protein n=1 Tax=Cyprinus carpio carpio TaxID=630221 RepID=A0A9J8CLA6_CYPCA
MMISCCFIGVLSVVITKVSLQDTVEAIIGGSVVLPCSSTEHYLKLQDINVHWRHNGSKIVYDIVKGEDSVVLQDQEYKNRAESFPPEYLRGNFSIKLNNLQHTDAGTYSCYITPSSEQKTVELIINESTAETGNKSTNQGNQGEDTVFTL